MDQLDVGCVVLRDGDGTRRDGANWEDRERKDFTDGFIFRADGGASWSSRMDFEFVSLEIPKTIIRCSSIRQAGQEDRSSSAAHLWLNLP